MRTRMVSGRGHLGTGGRAGVRVAVVACGILFGGVSSASAGVSFGVSPHLGGPLKVGTTGDAASLKITNQSNGPEASLNVTLSTISLVPSCGTESISGQDCPPASVDPGVLRLSLTGSGEAGTACAGMTFTTAVVDAGEGKYQISPSGSPVVLGPTGGASAVCTIDFTVDVLKMPTKDANPALGEQTDQVGSAAGQAGDGASGAGFGTSEISITGPSSTSVYWDTTGNLAADPNPFGGTPPSGANNVALGQLVLHKLTTGHDNLATGFAALGRNTTGSFNLGMGNYALSSNTTASSNVASGYGALFSNTTGSSNVASGINALYHSSGTANTAIGSNALLGNTTGSSNLAIGNGAGQNLSMGSNNLDIGSPGVAADSAKIRIGSPGIQTAAFLQGVSGVTIPGPTKTVVVNSSGQLGTAPAGTVPPARAGIGSTVDPALTLRLERQAKQLRHQAAELRQLTAQLHAISVLLHKSR